jgi:NADH:ubiquinone oxidoreductase subunit 6 (subunit J)
LYVIVCSLISGDGIAIAASFVSLNAPLLLLLRDKIDVTGALRVVIFFVVAFLEEEEEDRADAAVGETVRWMAIIATLLSYVRAEDLNK